MTIWGQQKDFAEREYVKCRATTIAALRRLSILELLSAS